MKVCPASGVAIAAMAVTAAVGLLVIGSNGAPSRLSPEVQRIYSSAERTGRFTSDACFADSDGHGATPADIRAGKLCIIGPATGPAPSFLLWGDSHAGAVLPALEKLAAEQGQRGYFVGRSSCVPLIDYRISSSNAAWTAAREANLETLDLIRAAQIKLFPVAAGPAKYRLEFGNEDFFDQSGRTPFETDPPSAAGRKKAALAATAESGDVKACQRSATMSRTRLRWRQCRAGWRWRRPANGRGASAHCADAVGAMGRGIVGSRSVPTFASRAMRVETGDVVTPTRII